LITNNRNIVNLNYEEPLKLIKRQKEKSLLLFYQYLTRNMTFSYFSVKSSYHPGCQDTVEIWTLSVAIIYLVLSLSLVPYLYFIGLVDMHHYSCNSSSEKQPHRNIFKMSSLKLQQEPPPTYFITYLAMILQNIDIRWNML
jgi:hypothetical protein